MTTPITTNRRDTAECRSVFDWGWPDEAQLAVFVEQAALVVPSDRAEMVHRLEPTGQLGENNSAYAALYFVS